MNTKQITEVYKKGLIKKETSQPSLTEKGVLCCMEATLYRYSGSRWEVVGRN